MEAAIQLVTFNNSLVTPKHDAVIHDLAVKNGIIYGCEVTVKDNILLHITAGMGILYGRQFEIFGGDKSVILAPNSSAVWKGRIYVHIDLGNTEEPVQLLTETAPTLKELKDAPGINLNNGASDMELATFLVDAYGIYDLKETYKKAGEISADQVKFTRLSGEESDVQTMISELGGKIANSGGTMCFYPYYVSGMTNAYININLSQISQNLAGRKLHTYPNILATPQLPVSDTDTDFYVKGTKRVSDTQFTIIFNKAKSTGFTLNLAFLLT